MISRFQTTDEYQVEVFRAIGDPIRLEIMRRMVFADEVACTTLESALPVSKSTISYHIKTLSGVGLIEVRKEGRNYFYKLRRDLMDEHLPGLYSLLRHTERARLRDSKSQPRRSRTRTELHR